MRKKSVKWKNAYAKSKNMSKNKDVMKRITVPPPCITRTKEKLTLSSHWQSHTPTQPSQYLPAGFSQTSRNQLTLRLLSRFCLDYSLPQMCCQWVLYEMLKMILVGTMSIELKGFVCLHGRKAWPVGQHSS